MACQDHRPERPPVSVTGHAGTLPSGLREAFLAQMLRGPMDELVVSPAGEREDSPGEVWLQTLTLTLSVEDGPPRTHPHSQDYLVRCWESRNNSGHSLPLEAACPRP